jgi:hypothetical protein
MSSYLRCVKMAYEAAGLLGANATVLYVVQRRVPCSRMLSETAVVSWDGYRVQLASSKML